MPTPPNSRALRVLETIYSFLLSSGSWPSFTELDRYLDMRGEPDAEAVLVALPPGLAHGVGTRPLRDDQEIALTVAGLSACADAAEDLDLFIRVIQYAAELERAQLPHEPPPRLTSSAFATAVALPAAGRADLIRRLGAVLGVEHWGWSSASRNEEGWSFAVTRQVRRLRGVADVADYLSRTRGPLTADPDTASTDASLPASALAPGDQGAGETLEPDLAPVTALVSWTHSPSDTSGWMGPDNNAVLSFADLLRANGIDAEIDLYHYNQGVDWTRWGPRMVEDRDFVLVVASSGWKLVWEGRGDPSRNAGSAAEADALRSLFNRNRETFGQKVRLVLLPGTTEQVVPSGLDVVTRYPVMALDNNGIEDLLRDLTGQRRFPSPPLGPVPRLGPAEREVKRRTSEASTTTARDAVMHRLSPRQAALVAKASDPPVARSELWPSTATKHADLVRLRIVRPEADQGRIIRCAVDFGAPTVERRLVYTPDPMGISTALSLGVNVEDLEVDFPGQFTDGHLFQPMHRGRYHYSWIANYGRVFEPSTRIVAYGYFNWP